MNKDDKNLTPAEKWDRITISNRFMFYKIFTTYPDKLHELLEILLKIKIDRITPPEGEKTFDTDIDSKSIRLDIYTQDENHVYDVEMQACYEEDLPKRARYYQGLMDVDILTHGRDYSELKSSIIIFICTFDYFKKGLPFYTFQNNCLEKSDIKLNDMTTKIFINATAYDKLLNEEQKDLLGYIMGNNPSRVFSKNVDSLVVQHRKNAQWRHRYMTLEWEINHRVKREVAEQLAERLDEKINEIVPAEVQKAKIENAIYMIKKFNAEPEIIAKDLGLPLNEIQKALQTVSI